MKPWEREEKVEEQQGQRKFLKRDFDVWYEITELTGTKLLSKVENNERLDGTEEYKEKIREETHYHVICNRYLLAAWFGFLISQDEATRAKTHAGCGKYIQYDGPDNVSAD